jgi:hypothetical protein
MDLKQLNRAVAGILGEKQDLYEMSNLSKALTGLKYVIWVGPSEYKRQSILIH